MSQKRSVWASIVGLVSLCALGGMSSLSARAAGEVSTITTGGRPYGLTINPAGTFAYVVHSGNDSNVVSKINLTTDEVSSITIGGRPSDSPTLPRLAINPAGTFALVRDVLIRNSATVYKINLVTDEVSTIPVGLGNYSSVAFNRDGTFAYVLNNVSNTISKIKLADDTVTTIVVGSFPSHMVFNPAGTFAYVRNSLSNTVSKIRLATDEVSTITIGALPNSTWMSDFSGIFGLVINPAGTFAYVWSPGSDYAAVSKINLTTDVVSTITLGLSPISLTINPAGTFAYVTHERTNKLFGEPSTVSKINLTTDVVSTIAVGSSPDLWNIDPFGTFAYVANSASGTVSKINLATESVSATIAVGVSPVDVAINRAGTFAYVANSASGTVSKIALTATDPQSITFESDSQLLGAKTFALSAKASSGLTVTYGSSTPTVCTASGSTVTMLTTGSCIIDANQVGGSGWDAASQVSRTFMILPSPPPGETGVSIEKGNTYINTKKVTLNLVWPKYATSVRISNDGGFGEYKTQIKALAGSIDWELDDSVKGIFTKVVYVRFNGVSDTMKTYSDDIILDTTAPVVDSVSAAAESGQIKVSLTATDDITGVNNVQIKSGTTTVTKVYSKKLSVSQKDLGLTVASSGVMKFASSSIEIRVSDKAGNWSAFQSLSLSGALKRPTVTTKKSATAKSFADYAKLTVTKTSKLSLKVSTASKKYCAVVATKVKGVTTMKLKGLKRGTCKVTVTVTPKKGLAKRANVTLKIS